MAIRCGSDYLKGSQSLLALRILLMRLTPRTPAGLHMPGPSWAPIFASIGVFLLFLGIVFPGPILVLGGIALVLTLLYWLTESVRIYDHDLGEQTSSYLPATAGNAGAREPHGSP